MQSDLNIEKIRKDFPIFKNNPELIYLDNAATTQKPKIVINKLITYYENYNSNVHRGIYKIAEKATAEYENTRSKIATFIGAPDEKNIIFTKGTTESINLVANSWGKKLKTDDEILITEMEHHSNIVPWQLICNTTGAKLKYIPINEDGTLDLTNTDNLFTDKTKMVSLIHQSNVFGTINPIENIIKMAHDVGALVMIDGAQSIPHHPINVLELGCDFYTFSGHKMLGPTGIGVLYGKSELLNEMEPFLGGGEMIQNVSMENSTWNSIPWKFEAGTPNIAQVISMSAAIDYIISIGFEKIIKHEKELLKYCIEKLDDIPELSIYGNNKNDGAIISFNLKNIHPHDVAQILDQYGIAIRAGHHCAQPIMKRLNVSATNRISFYFYNNLDEIDKLVDRLKTIIKLF